MTGRGVVRLSCLLGLLCVVAAPREATSFPGRSGEALHSERGDRVADRRIRRMAANPTVISFSCDRRDHLLDCHRAGKDGLMLAQVQDNKVVQALRAKGEKFTGQADLRTVCAVMPAAVGS